MCILGGVLVGCFVGARVRFVSLLRQFAEMSVSSDEVNLLIYRYLVESGTLRSRVRAAACAAACVCVSSLCGARGA